MFLLMWIWCHRGGNLRPTLTLPSPHIFDPKNLVGCCWWATGDSWDNLKWRSLFLVGYAWVPFLIPVPLLAIQAAFDQHVLLSDKLGLSSDKFGPPSDKLGAFL